MKSKKCIPLIKNWTLSNSENSISLQIDSPTTVFEALIHHKIIPDPFYGQNEQTLQWVSEDEWTYKTTFDLTQEMLSYHNLVLIFHGLDTFAEVSLNGKIVLETENMHRRYELFLVDEHQKQDEQNSSDEASIGNSIEKIYENIGYAKKGKNRLEIIFRSAQKEVELLSKKTKAMQKSPQYIAGVELIRKAQYSFGWDWGPTLPDVGIWKPIELVADDGLHLGDLETKQNFVYNLDPETCPTENLPSLSIEDVNLICRIDVPNEFASNDSKVVFRLKTPDGEILENEIFIQEVPSKGLVQTNFRIENPIVWWTHDLGEPALHELAIELWSDSYLIDRQIHSIGIRDLQLIRTSDEWGESFYFRLNGIPVFAKGANWIPVDSFIPRGEKLKLTENTLHAAQEANMNMIRVWGGGVYESDVFYDTCDQLGLLVWQDFAFACAFYRADEDFLNNFAQEAQQQLIRLRNHPSLALWCGNNEIEMLFENMFVQDIKNPLRIPRLRKNYRKLFFETLPALVHAYDSNTPYWRSSPSSGTSKIENYFVANDQNRGDSHFWAVWHMNRPFTAYRTFNSRFMSEYGFESFPEMKTLRAIAPDDAMDFYHPIMENHQKNSAGNKKIMDYMQARFTVPQAFESQVTLSQITQAEAIEYGIEHWRRNRNDFHCMGSLFWQLNDCWPVASWSSIDYFGRWKALHYYAKRCYQPLFSSICESYDKFEFWVTNDTKQKFIGTLQCEVFSIDGTVIELKEVPFEMEACQSKLVETIDLDEKIMEANQEQIVAFVQLVNNDGQTLHQNFRLLVAPKLYELPNPDLSFKIQKNENETLKLEIISENISLYTHITSDAYDFVSDDNFFSMRKGESRILTLRQLKTHDDSMKETSLSFEESIQIKSLFDLQ